MALLDSSSLRTLNDELPQSSFCLVVVGWYAVNGQAEEQAVSVLQDTGP